MKKNHIKIFCSKIWSKMMNVQHYFWHSYFISTLEVKLKTQPQNYTIITLIFQHYAQPNNMINYTSWPIIVSYMIAIGQTG
jgi:hypothetical protein